MFLGGVGPPKQPGSPFPDIFFKFNLWNVIPEMSSTNTESLNKNKPVVIAGELQRLLGLKTRVAVVAVAVVAVADN